MYFGNFQQGAKFYAFSKRKKNDKFMVEFNGYQIIDCQIILLPLLAFQEHYSTLVKWKKTVMSFLNASLETFSAIENLIDFCYLFQQKIICNFFQIGSKIFRALLHFSSNLLELNYSEMRTIDEFQSQELKWYIQQMLFWSEIFKNTHIDKQICNQVIFQMNLMPMTNGTPT